ncbi:MAG: iron chelate uptake ABC transporter family permease subunit [Bacteroidales bacterium]
MMRGRHPQGTHYRAIQNELAVSLSGGGGATETGTLIHGSSPDPLLLVLLAVLLLLAALDLRMSLSIPFPGCVFPPASGGPSLTENQALILFRFRASPGNGPVGAWPFRCAALYMQTLFRNPLAGPYVLGISSGASLGAALVVMGGGGLAWRPRWPSLPGWGRPGSWSCCCS